MVLGLEEVCKDHKVFDAEGIVIVIWVVVFGENVEEIEETKVSVITVANGYFANY